MTPAACQNPHPRPWWGDNTLSARARDSYPTRHERPHEWAALASEIRAEVAGGAHYAADVVAMTRAEWMQVSYLEAA